VPSVDGLNGRVLLGFQDVVRRCERSSSRVSLQTLKATNLVFGQQYTLTDVRPSGTCTTGFSVGLDATTQNPTYTVIAPNGYNMTNPPTGSGQTITLLPPAT
jgi:hypothetical protein